MIVLTRWRSLTQPTGERAELTWSDVREQLFARPLEIADKKKIPGFALAAFEGNRRALSKVEAVHALTLDYDAGGTSLEDAASTWSDVAGVVHTTHSHTPEAPRFRVIVLFARAVTAAEYSTIFAWAQKRARDAGHAIDPAPKDSARLWFVPAVRPGGEYRAIDLTGEPLNVDAVLASRRAALPESRYAAGALTSAVQRVERAANGARNDTLNREAHAIAQLVAGGEIDRQLAEDALHDAAARAGLEESETRATLRSAFTAGARSPRTRPTSPATTSAPPPNGITHDATDLRNAERLVERHAHELRFVGTWGKWIAWDGARWAVDDTGHALRCASETSRVLVAEALDRLTPARRVLDEAQVSDGGDRDRRISDAKRAVGQAEKLFQWAVQSQQAPRLRAMLDVARAFRAIAVHHEQLDADPMLLNVQNGTIDLRTGLLRDHRRDDLITKLAPVRFDASASAPIFDAFLARVMGGDSELGPYVQRLIGYGVTGEVREHALVFSWGAGANGKSTLWGIVHAMLGDYATPAPRGLLFRARGERHPTELASLHRRRFVTCSEVEEGQTFDEALVKDLTGGDPIECRRMREDFWSFQPTHKLFISGNHKPTVRGDDEGIWRRMQLVPWTVTIPEAERDPLLPAKLRTELPGILAWAVRGCLEWQARGLCPPPSVRAATIAYRDENDVLGQFFRLHVVFEQVAQIARKALREAYEGFCRENGAETLGAKRFSARLRERGVSECKVRTVSGPRDGWNGVRLASEIEQTRRSEIRLVVSGLGIDSTRARTHAKGNRESGTTGHYSLHDDGDDDSFADFVDREVVGGGK